MITVRELGPQDWELWRALRLAALRSDPAAFGSRYEDWVDASEMRWRQRLTDVPTFVFENDGLPAGVASLAYIVGQGPELISLWIDPAQRRNGMGALAVRWIQDRAAKVFPGEILSLSVAVGNQAARRLYTRLGFVEAGMNPDDPSELRMVCCS